MSTFSGINLSSRALAAAQRSMEVTGQNIANANTEGYSRQRVEQTSVAAATAGTWTLQRVAGAGVEITGITRVADALADAAARQDAATAAEQGATSRVWSDVERSLGEPGASGLTQLLGDMHRAWGDLASANGTDAAATARADVILRSQAVVEALNGIDTQLQAQWSDQRDAARTLAEDATTTAARIAGLNATILQATAAGTSANELLDQRESAITRLAELTGARVVQRDNGVVDVYVGNTAIVSGTSSVALQVHAPQPFTLGDAKAGTAALTVTVGGTPVQPVSGRLKATLDAVNTTLPKVSAQIDAVAGRIAAAVNAEYTAGGSPVPFFDAPATDTARGLRVNPSVTPTSFTDSTSGVDREVARRIAALVGEAGGTAQTWRDAVVDVAARTQAAGIRADLASQTALKSTVTRESVSGVNVDEEMSNLVAFQHAYAAAARVLTTIDQALDTLINRTGLVGR